MVSDRPSIRVSLPDGWTREESAAGVVARPAVADPADPTNVTVAVVAHSSPITDVDDYALVQVRDLTEVLADAVVVDLAVDRDGPQPTVDLVVAHEMLGADLTSRQRHTIGADGVVVIASAATSDVRWPAWRPVLEAIVESVEVDW